MKTTQCTELGTEKYLSDFMLQNRDFVGKTSHFTANSQEFKQVILLFENCEIDKQSLPHKMQDFSLLNAV